MADYQRGLSVGLATSAVPGVARWFWPSRVPNMDADTVELFLNNPVFTPTLKTILIAALKKICRERQQ